MSIPDSLKGALDAEQVAALNAFEKSCFDGKIPDPYEECCCGSGHTFHVMPSGIGDSIWIVIKDRRFVCSRDDDGDIIGETTL